VKVDIVDMHSFSWTDEKPTCSTNTLESVHHIQESFQGAAFKYENTSAEVDVDHAWMIRQFKESKSRTWDAANKKLAHMIRILYACARKEPRNADGVQVYVSLGDNYWREFLIYMSQCECVREGWPATPGQSHGMREFVTKELKCSEGLSPKNTEQNVSMPDGVVANACLQRTAHRWGRQVRIPVEHCGHDCGQVIAAELVGLLGARIAFLIHQGYMKQVLTSEPLAYIGVVMSLIRGWTEPSRVVEVEHDVKKSASRRFSIDCIKYCRGRIRKALIPFKDLSQCVEMFLVSIWKEEAISDVTTMSVIMTRTRSECMTFRSMHLANISASFRPCGVVVKKHDSPLEPCRCMGMEMSATMNSVRTDPEQYAKLRNIRIRDGEYVKESALMRGLAVYHMTAGFVAAYVALFFIHVLQPEQKRLDAKRASGNQEEITALEVSLQKVIYNDLVRSGVILAIVGFRLFKDIIAGDEPWYRVLLFRKNVEDLCSAIRCQERVRKWPLLRRRRICEHCNARKVGVCVTIAEYFATIYFTNTMGPIMRKGGFVNALSADPSGHLDLRCFVTVRDLERVGCYVMEDHVFAFTGKGVEQYASTTYASGIVHIDWDKSSSLGIDFRPVSMRASGGLVVG
jgi:hypothetical protein